MDGTERVLETFFMHVTKEKEVLQCAKGLLHICFIRAMEVVELALIQLRTHVQPASQPGPTGGTQLCAQTERPPLQIPALKHSVPTTRRSTSYPRVPA